MISAGLYIITTLVQTLILLLILIGCIMVVTVGVKQDMENTKRSIDDALQNTDEPITIRNLKGN